MDGGGYPEVARRIESVAEHLVERRVPESWFEADERMLGPLVMTKAALEPQGRYDELRRDIVKLCDDCNEATDGSFLVHAEYLLSVAQMPA